MNLMVDDVNSPPVFLEHPFSVRIPEDAPIGFPVVLLKALDHDRGSNAEITYSLASRMFSVDNKTGQVCSLQHMEEMGQVWANPEVTGVVGGSAGSREEG